MFQLFQIVSGENAYDTVLYPAVTVDRHIAAEPDEGPTHSVLATHLTGVAELPGRKAMEFADFKEISAEVGLMQSRLTVHCARFDTGTTYGGISATGAVIGLVQTAVSKHRAANRNQGLALVAHIRYPWLHYVGGYTSRIMRAEILHVSVRVPTGQDPLTMSLRMFLKYGSDAIGLARWIAQTAAGHNLRLAGLPPDAAARLTPIAQGQFQLAKEMPSGLTGLTMPWSLPVPPDRS